MKCLWLTLADPDPAMNGQFLYSSGLIHSVAAAGLDLWVVGLSLPGGQHEDGQETGRIRWRLAPHQPRSRWSAIRSYFPKLADRTRTRSLRRTVAELLKAGDWDAIVFDSFNLGWALSAMRNRYRNGNRPRLVYIAHNHEESLARAVAAEERHPVKRLIKRLDAVKLAWLERALARDAGLITSNTPEDCAKFRRRWPDKPIEFVPPGYSGQRTTARRITSETPRRAIIVGSFDWLAKRQSLAALLAVADPLFAAAGVELYVVGQAEESFLNALRKSAAATIFTGRVEDVSAYMSQARLALVPDRTPGFKLKGLDYVFNRLPIFALADSLPGMPLADEDSAMFYPNYERLAEGVIQSIDDLERLNRLQEHAYQACCDQFDWGIIGKQLCSAIARTKSPEVRSAGIRRSAGRKPVRAPRS
jgi:glycosyltransferase involved in cell wall biosynthesis